MATFGTTFKRIYGEGLKKYGFKKIKGRQPYFVRMIGDEIIHIITYRPVNAYNFSHKEYEIYGGIATVYRANIDLDKTPRDNAVWLSELYHFYKKCDDGGEKEKYEEIGLFSYEKDNEQAMAKSIEYSLEKTEKYVIPRLDKITNVREGVDFFKEYNTTLLTIKRNFGKGQSSYEYNEGLLNVLVYTLDEYISYVKNLREECNNRILNEMRTGLNGFTMEEYRCDKKRREEKMERKIEIFTEISNSPEKYREVMEELERRKEHNLEVLKQYGVNTN